MHKEIIICFIIIVLIISIDLITKKYTEASVIIINNKLDNIKEKILKEENINNEDIKNEINCIMDEWKTRYARLAFFIEHDELEKVETELISLSACIDVEKYDDGIENIERCIFILNHIKEKYNLKVKNIF